ncbi:MAG: SMP-30/gluconolactonase/LRE family protein [Saprospiraceae bacterium]|nr:SMP-30/gluconolactonase/LRE family protein [Saprospiraceae bacterium]
MKNLLKAILVLIFFAVLYLAFWPIDLEPVVFQVPKNPGLEGVFAKNNELASAEKMLEGVGIGPEDIAISVDSQLYTGVEDGRIIQFSFDGKNQKVFANTGGRPFGMKFDTSGNLIVTDAEKGLLSIDPTGSIAVLATEVNGSKIFFADDLDIAADGTIYFSDASQRNHDVIHEALELQPTGRLLSYHPTTKKTKVELEGFRFANGVTFGPNEDYLLVNETFGLAIHKYWLKGSKKGQKEVFNNELPGFPDNINYNGNDIFWLAIPNVRPAKAFEYLYDKPFWRKVIIRMGESVYRGVEPKPFGMIVGLDLEGNVVHNFQDSTGIFHDITSVSEFEGALWFGSLKMKNIGRFELK